MMAQILRQGNKRTAKCLFNKMVLSRGLLPPIMDLTQNDYSLCMILQKVMQLILY